MGQPQRSRRTASWSARRAGVRAVSARHTCRTRRTGHRRAESRPPQARRCREGTCRVGRRVGTARRQWCGPPGRVRRREGWHRPPPSGRQSSPPAMPRGPGVDGDRPGFACGDDQSPSSSGWSNRSTRPGPEHRVSPVRRRGVRFGDLALARVWRPHLRISSSMISSQRSRHSEQIATESVPRTRKSVRAGFVQNEQSAWGLNLRCAR